MTTLSHDAPASPKLKSWHLDRSAVVYIRQSTPQQVLEHQESTARQYALTDRAVDLGWSRPQVHVIDDDLGKSGRSIEGRAGFQRLLAEVALDRVGLILGLEMSRLARSCKDWHHLIDLCARFRVLLADAESIYDPTEYSDRLLLGLTGMMNEAELHVLKQRMYQGKLNKARRGELVVAVPVGYVKSPAGEVALDPDEQVQEIVRTVFDQFDRQGTVHGVLRHLIACGIRMPLRRRGGPDRGELDWRPPCRETVRHILRHPIYAGAYIYGFRPVDPRRRKPGSPNSGRESGLAAEECQVFLRDRHPAYISWDRFETNRRRMAANRSRVESPGAVRDGAALLAGVVRCGRCGRRMYVRYRRSGGRPTYVCSTLRSDYGLPLRQSVSVVDAEAWVAQEVLEALQPAALDASLEAASRVDEQRRQAIRDWERRVERARYEADRAGRQYHACEPENRLVGRTLERRWDEALQAVRKVEEGFDRFLGAQPRVLGEADRERIRRLAAEIPTLWHAPTTTNADRRRIVRLLIERVVLTLNSEDDHVVVRVEWAGGAVRQRMLRREVFGYKKQQQWKPLSGRLAALHGRGETPNAIATILDREGFRPPKRATRFTGGIVRRLLHEIELRPRVPRSAAAGALSSGEVWLHDLAQTLALSPYTLHGWRKKGWLHARQSGGRGGPWAVWIDATELDRLRGLKEYPRLWNHQEQLARLRTPGPRDD
ncbi:recombinase family protein [Paludisphaera mucosa]|uniref:Recombinase family protein n=1 Tax=Paludisphaera mucosa TaxID=3030827 RepID=A0ABT6FLC8_9BACT|nr:recombinase family protein [Paludisphaera mucosa]MDG3008377.1 recombinase family protein [Paludisphaera mucosa]